MSPFTNYYAGKFLADEQTSSLSYTKFEENKLTTDLILERIILF